MNALADETVLWLHRDRAELLVRAADAFRELRDPCALGLATGQQRAVEGLLGLASDGSAGCGLLTAPAGLGKTLVRTSLQRQLPPARCATVVVESGLLDFDDLLLEVLSQLRGERVMPARLPGRYERLAELKSALVSEVVATGRHLVLLLDDADRASTATLDAVGALMNLSSDRHTFVVPVLFGQPSLRQSLARLPALRQRVGAQFTLQALDATESLECLERRLRTIGLGVTQVFETGLAARLHEAAAGVPRVLNQLCRLALRNAAQHGRSLATDVDLDAGRSLVLDSGTAASAVYLGQ
jgi:type II secretory pathway predicted ATPase ExeA